MSRYKQPYSLFKRGKYWYFQTYTKDGVRTTAKTTGKKTKTEAKLYCDELFKNGELGYKKTLFCTYTKDFFSDNSPYLKDRGRPLSEFTVKEYRSILEYTLLPYFSNMELQDINYTVIKTFRVALLENLTVNTVVAKMNVLKIIIKNAYKDRIIRDNPFEFLEPLEKNYNSKDAFTLSEIKEIYNNLQNEQDKNLVLLAALTGLRISEAIGMRSQEVKNKDNVTYLDVFQQWDYYKYIPPKYSSYREVPIIPEIEKLLNFPVQRLSSFYASFVPLKNKYETDKRKLSFHSIRHFFVTNSKAWGIPEVKVEYIVGHKLKGIRGVYTNFKAGDVAEITNYQRYLLDQLESKEPQ